MSLRSELALRHVRAIHYREMRFVYLMPRYSVENTKREDIAFIAFQFWLLGMSLVALLNESIPHMYVLSTPQFVPHAVLTHFFSVASLLTHILATAWGGFQIVSSNISSCLSCLTQL